MGKVGYWNPVPPSLGCFSPALIGFFCINLFGIDKSEGKKDVLKLYLCNFCN